MMNLGVSTPAHCMDTGGSGLSWLGQGHLSNYSFLFSLCGAHCLTWNSCRSLTRSLQVTTPCSVLCTCWPSCPETQVLPRYFLCSKLFKSFAVSAEKAHTLYPTIRGLSGLLLKPLSSCSFLQEVPTPIQLPVSGHPHPSAPCLGSPPLWNFPQLPSLGQLLCSAWFPDISHILGCIFPGHLPQGL